MPDDWRLLREVRLTALSEAPDAFGSSYRREAAFGEAHWRARLSAGVTLFAYLAEISGAGPAGIAGGFDAGGRTVELVSMWVRPQARGHGVSDALVEAVTDWARAQDAAALHLWVTETNAAARALYERHGFIWTGDRQALPSNPDLTEISMRRPLEHVPPSRR